MLIIIFEDYDKTGCLYHVISILDYKNVVRNGIKYDDKNTYIDKYYGFHAYFDDFKSERIPSWVERKKAIYTSLNYKDNHQWHSHSVILKVLANENKCWVCNENLANILYEPFVLQGNKYFEETKEFMNSYGPKAARKYWDESISLLDNKKVRKDKMPDYDAEVLVFENIKPEDIECIYVISDHKMMSIKEWQEYFRSLSKNWNTL